MVPRDAACGGAPEPGVMRQHHIINVITYSLLVLYLSGKVENSDARPRSLSENKSLNADSTASTPALLKY